MCISQLHFSVLCTMYFATPLPTFQNYYCYQLQGIKNISIPVPQLLKKEQTPLRRFHCSCDENAASTPPNLPVDNLNAQQVGDTTFGSMVVPERMAILEFPSFMFGIRIRISNDTADLDRISELTDRNHHPELAIVFTGFFFQVRNFESRMNLRLSKKVVLVLLILSAHTNRFFLPKRLQLAALECERNYLFCRKKVNSASYVATLIFNSQLCPK